MTSCMCDDGRRREEEEEEAAGYRTKNKNPTQRCGEISIYLWGQQPARLIHLYFRVPEAGSMCGTRFSGLVAKRHLSFAMRWGVSLLQYLRIPQNEHGWISTVCGMNTLSLELVSPPAKSAANKSSSICILLPLQLWDMNESVDAFLAFFQVDTC